MTDEAFFVLRVDCEATQPAVDDQALGERAVRGLVDVVEAEGGVPGGSKNWYLDRREMRKNPIKGAGIRGISRYLQARSWDTRLRCSAWAIAWPMTTHFVCSLHRDLVTAKPVFRGESYRSAPLSGPASIPRTFESSWSTPKITFIR